MAPPTPSPPASSPQPSPQPAAAAAAPVQGPMTPMTGVLGNVTAVLSHATGRIPTLKADWKNLRESTAPTKSRRISALKLAGAAVVIAALGFAIYKEWQIHIVNAPITAAGQASKTANEARLMQLKTNVGAMQSVQDGDKDLICADPEMKRRFGDKYGCPAN